MIAIFPEIANLVAQGDIEALACHIRKYFGGPRAYSPIIDVEQLMLYAGINVQASSDIEAGALLARDQGGRFTVLALVNERRQDPVDRNLTLAHLLGHFLLHVQAEIARGEGGAYAFQEQISPLERWTASTRWSQIQWDSEQDRQADLFALALVLPLGMIKRAAKQLADPYKLAKFFGVTHAIVNLRLGLIVEDAEPSSSHRRPETQSAGIAKPVENQAFSKLTGNSKARGIQQIEQMEMQNSLVKGQRLLAGQRYRSQPPQEAAESDQSPGLETSLKKLRMIARRLDSSVKL